MDLNDPLYRSLIDEREMLLAHRERLQAALTQILHIANSHLMSPRKNEALLGIAGIAEAALSL